MPVDKNLAATATPKPATKVPKMQPKPAEPTTETNEYPLTESKPTAVPTQVSNPQTSAIAQAAKKVQLPGWLVKSQMPEVADRQLGGFVGFASSQSGKWNEQQLSGLTDGQPYLYHQQRYIPLASLDFFLLAGESFQTLMVGKEGQFKWASRDLEEEGPMMGSNRPEPHYVCLLIVAAEGRWIPIKGDFRGTKSGGIEGAIRAVEAAATPEWASLSDAHRVSCAFPQAFGRVYHRCTTKYQVSKTSGNPYYRANCISNPATVTQMQELVDVLSDEEFIEQLNECRKNYDERIALLDGIAAKGRTT